MNLGTCCRLAVEKTFAANRVDFRLGAIASATDQKATDGYRNDP